MFILCTAYDNETRRRNSYPIEANQPPPQPIQQQDPRNHHTRSQSGDGSSHGGRKAQTPANGRGAPPNGSAGRPVFPASMRPPPRADKEISVEASHVNTAGQINPLMTSRTRPPPDYSFADVASPSSGRYDLPQIPTISEIYNAVPITSPAGEPELSAVPVAAQANDAAKIGPLISEDKPLYVRRGRSQGGSGYLSPLSESPSPGQSQRREDSDAESEGSRHSGRSRFSRSREQSRSGEMAVKDSRKSDSEGSQYTARPGLGSYENGNQGPVYQQVPVNPGIRRPIAGPSIDSRNINDGPRPRFPGAQGNMLPTAQPVGAPGVHDMKNRYLTASPEEMLQGGPVQFRPPHLQPRMQPGPNPRPMQTILPYPPRNPRYPRPVGLNQPSNFASQGQAPLQMRPAIQRPTGQVPLAGEPLSKEALLAAQYGRNVRGDPLLVRLEGWSRRCSHRAYSS